MDFVPQKLRKKKWQWFLAGAILIILIFAYFFVKDVLTIRSQILSGDYDLERFGGEVSGKKGINFGPQKYDLATNDDPGLGNLAAKVTIVEFGDFECPYCRRAFPVVRSLMNQYQEEARFIYRDFPLSDIHPVAQLAAQGGYCAERQNKFWAYHDNLFLNQDLLSRDYLFMAAAQAGLDVDQFSSCLESEEAQKEVRDDFSDGLAAGVQGTPTWFINGQRVAGVIPEAVFRKIIEDLLR